MDINNNFLKGRMNKSYDERVLPEGEYIDALNIRIGSTESNSVGAVENSLGNTKLTSLIYNGSSLSNDARCIGVFEDGSNETIYWFVCDPRNVDLIMSYNERSKIIKYHVISTSVLNFDHKYLINGINKVDNLLFFTDGINPPRKINVDRDYPNPVSGVDAISEYDISVVVAPPTESPTVTFINTPGEENYITERFISFSYRYKYRDNEYSALSQFSSVAFEPGSFELDFSTYTNKAMQNVFNTVGVEFNTGGPNVIGVDLCFKLSDSSIINVIERFDKVEQGWTDNTVQSVMFNNRKIYTALPSSELSRLYDNVPRFANAQTMMGNRLVYGNYVDGYDIDTTIDYDLDLVSETIGYLDLPYELGYGADYTIDPDDTVQSDNSAVSIDLSGVDLVEGSLLSLSFNLFHESFSGYAGYDDPPTSPAPQNEFQFDFIFTLRQDYASVYDLVTSDEFVNAMYTHNSYATACDGFSVTDNFNCSIVPKGVFPPFTVGWNDIASGITGVDGGFEITATPGSNIFQIQVPAVKYSIEDPDNPGEYFYAYEYFRNAVFNAAFSKLGARQSLHSNRDYEVAIVYADDYLRSSTALVNTMNTVFVPASGSDKKNYIVATINNLAPSWATRYKFVVKPSKTNYEIIYTNQFFSEDTGLTWFRLEGENISKVKRDDVLIVKSDTNGVTDTLVKTKVLEVKAQSSDFISGNKDDGGQDIMEPAGVYMALKASNFAAEYKPNSYIDFGNKQTGKTTAYPCYINNPEYDPDSPVSPTNKPYMPYDIPAGSRVKFFINLKRGGRGGSCGSFGYLFDKTFTASQDYDNIFDFVLGDNIDFGSGIPSGGEAPNDNDQSNTLGAWTDCGTIYSQNCHLPFIQGVNQYEFQEDPDDGRLFLVVTTGQPSCGGIEPKYSRTDVHITVQRATSLVVFETESLDADGEIYFEGSDSFPIVNRLHMSGNEAGDQNQLSATVPAIVNLNFFNCYSFGNGVESYKINDSITGAPLYLGSRVTAVAQEEYKQADRYASLTYSGIYNAETNINKLNEFNLSLANFKDLEKSFGPVNLLYARKTDILTLQEDKISYVLAGKNLLADSAGGGQVASIPEVLGTQIARIEDYGISSNPESFAVRGGEIYFTDAKRSAVLNLRGGSSQSDALSVISDSGMKYWFRDEFKESLNYQKIGGFDPYMNEYVVSINSREIPTTVDTYACGTTISQRSFIGEYSFLFEMPQTVGDVALDFNVTEGSISILVVYNSNDVINQVITGSGTLSFNKDLVFPDNATVTVTASSSASYSMTLNCPVSEEITVVSVVVSSPESVSKTIHTAYNWELRSFESPNSSSFVVMQESGTSLYSPVTGMNSTGVIPAIGGVINMVSAKLTGDTYTFDEATNGFRYLVTDSVYTVNDVDTLLLDSSSISPVLNPSTGRYTASFDYDNDRLKRYLYLVWDYRVSE